MKKYLAAGMLLVFFSCNNSEHQQAGNSSDSTSAKVTSAPSVKLADGKSQAIYDNYITLKDALVATSFDNAKQSAVKLKTSLMNFEGCENTALIADKISNAKDIVEQRKEFTSLSADVIAMFKHSDLSGGKIYVQHCPMANKGDGGDWLSSDKKIQNPYYGDEMLECGAVVEEIK